MWKSWNGSKVPLKEGDYWQVRNRERINIWEDKWIKDGQVRRILSVKPKGCIIEKVKEQLN